jgi:[ribulose-bisphosphate carboxylase]-lysine N-methyltransferase
MEAFSSSQERRLKGLGLLDDDGNTTYDSFFKDGIA